MDEQLCITKNEVVDSMDQKLRFHFRLTMNELLYYLKKLRIPQIVCNVATKNAHRPPLQQRLSSGRAFLYSNRQDRNDLVSIL